MEHIETKKLIEICRASGTRKVALFGSFARGEAGPNSDIDLIVLTEQAISPHLRERILKEQQVIYEEAG